MTEYTNTSNVVNAIRYAVKGRKAWAAFVADNRITRENLAETARELAALAFPNEETVQTVTVDGKKIRTVYGNAVQAAGFNLRSVLDKVEDDEDGTTTKNLLTREGKAATLDEVIAEWTANQS